MLHCSIGDSHSVSAGTQPPPGLGPYHPAQGLAQSTSQGSMGTWRQDLFRDVNTPISQIQKLGFKEVK